MSRPLKLCIAHPRYGKARMTLLHKQDGKFNLRLNTVDWSGGETPRSVSMVQVDKAIADKLLEVATPLYRNPALTGADDHIDFDGPSYLLTLQLRQARRRSVEAFSGTSAGRICEQIHSLMVEQTKPVHA